MLLVVSLCPHARHQPKRSSVHTATSVQQGQNKKGSPNRSTSKHTCVSTSNNAEVVVCGGGQKEQTRKSSSSSQQSSALLLLAKQCNVST